MTVVPGKSEILYLDPVKELDENLDYTWRSLREYYDTCGELPDMQSLFAGVDITTPEIAAEVVIANMLLDVVDNVCRFSPWYTKPARAFGLKAIRDSKTKSIRWILAPEAIQKWKKLIEVLANSIDQNSGLLQATLFVENLLTIASEDDKCITAKCGCTPPQTIRVNQSILSKTEIFCNICKLPFT